MALSKPFNLLLLVESFVTWHISVSYLKHKFSKMFQKECQTSFPKNIIICMNAFYEIFICFKAF